MSEMKLVSLEEVAKHSSRTDVWFIIEGLVYDVTHFLDEVRCHTQEYIDNIFKVFVKHPGGEEVMLELAGMDATEGFDQVLLL